MIKSIPVITSVPKNLFLFSPELSSPFLFHLPLSNIFSTFVYIEKERKTKSLSHVRLFATPWTRTYQAPLSMGFSRQEYWSGLSFPSPGDLPDPAIEPRSLHCRQTLYHLSHQGSLCIHNENANSILCYIYIKSLN